MPEKKRDCLDSKLRCMDGFYSIDFVVQCIYIFPNIE